MRFILDTCILIDEDQPELPDDVRRAARLRRLTVIENTVNALPVTDDIARIHGAMAAHLKSVGRRPRARAADLFVAATAASQQATLLTHNLVDFVGLEHFVTVEDR